MPSKQNKTNFNNGLVRTREKSVSTQATVSNQSSTLGADGKSQQLENKKFGKWIDKFSRLCPNSSEKRDPETEKLSSKKNPERSITTASSGSHFLLKGIY